MKITKNELQALIREESDRYKKGLYQVKIGDWIAVGKEGRRWKIKRKVSKILPDGKIVDENGNIFFPDGRLFRGGNKDSDLMKKYSSGKQVSAQIVTQRDFDEEYKHIKVDFLRKFDWNSLDITQLEKIIDVIECFGKR